MKASPFFLYSLLLWLFTSSTSLLYAQSNTIGFVTDEQTQLPLAGVRVELMNYHPIMSTHTNEQGIFKLIDVPTGKHRLLVEKEGYASQIYTFIKGQTNKIEIALKKFEDSPTLSIKDRLNTKITTASQNAENLANAPATIHVITAQEIEERGYTSLVDVLENIPEIEIQDKTSGMYYNHVTIRGIQGTERFLILRDGMRVNSMATTKHTVDKNFLIRYAKRIEIVLGPASALYGADAFTGVINIISKDGSEAKQVNIEGSYGLYNTTENHFFAGFGNKKVSFNINGGVYYSNEPNLSKFYPKEYAWYNEQYSVNGTLLQLNNDTIKTKIEPFSTPRLAYFGHARINIKDFEIGLIHNSQRHSSVTGNDPKFAPHIKSSLYSISLSNLYLKHNWSSKKNKVQVNSSLHNNLYIIDPNTKFNTVVNNYNKGFKYGFNSNLKLKESISLKLSTNHNLITGISYQYTYALPKTPDLPFKYKVLRGVHEQEFQYIGTNVRDSNGVNQGIPINFDFLDQHNAGAFLQYQGSFFKEVVLLTLGLRFDYSRSILRNTEHRNNTFQHYYDFNPRLGVVIKPVESFRLKLFYGEAFLAPSPEKRFAHYGGFSTEYDQNGNFKGFKGAYWHLSNRNLEPEKIRSAEFVTSYIGKTISIDLGAYYNHLSDLIYLTTTFNDTFLSVPIEKTQRFVNKASAYTYGGTLKVLFQHYFRKNKKNKIDLYASYSLSDGKLNDSIPIYYSAQHTAKAGITFSYQNFNLHTYGLFRTASINSTGRGNPSFFLVNAFASYKVFQSSSKKFAVALFVRVRNLTDARYYNTPSQQASYFMQAPQDPIRIMGGIRVSFMK